MKTKEFNFKYTHYDQLNELGSDEKRTLEAAREACNSAWAPYSGFKVGAAALLKSGNVVTASNQESEVFPSGLCAERNLLLHHASSEPHDGIVMLAIASLPNEKECYPCGECRQTLLDIQKRQGTHIKIIMTSGTTATVVEDATCLMPFAFSMDSPESV